MAGGTGQNRLLGSQAETLWRDCGHPAVNVLEWFMDIERQADNTKLAWVVGILLAFAASMLILAIADRLSEPKESRQKVSRR